MRHISAHINFFREWTCDALDNLLQAGLRNILAILGISVGTAAVVAMLHLGHNARIEAMRQFQELGVDLFIVRPQNTPDQAMTIIPLDLAKGMQAVVPGIQVSSPFISGGTFIRTRHKTVYVSMIATEDDLYAISNLTLASGRFTSFLDKFSPFVVIGQELVQEVSQLQGKTISVGDTLDVGGQVATIIGILNQANPNPLLGIEPARSLFMPFGAARRFMEDTQLSGIAARFLPGWDIAAGTATVEEYFRQSLRYGAVDVQTARQLIEGMDRQMRVYSYLLLAIGAVSLCVGGIGVMNVLLMSVMERQREIGLRRAIGARQVDIKMMFLVEALVLSSIGCIIGTGVGFGAGWGFSLFFGWSFESSLIAWPLGIGVACLVGIVSGSYPASRAARLDPVVALRG